MSRLDVRKIESRTANASAGIVRDRRSTPTQIRGALENLGREAGREINELFGYEATEVTTPLDEIYSTLTRRRSVSVVVSTKSDFEIFGSAISSQLSPSFSGFMDFGEVRGREALTAPIRELQLPKLDNMSVDLVVVAKSVLATGCTAVSLARVANDTYQPRNLVIATVFYSLEGIAELSADLGNAHLVVVGAPDHLDAHGMLHPGVGLLDQRIVNEDKS